MFFLRDWTSPSRRLLRVFLLLQPRRCDGIVEGLTDSRRPGPAFRQRPSSHVRCAFADRPPVRQTCATNNAERPERHCSASKIIRKRRQHGRRDEYRRLHFLRECRHTRRHRIAVASICAAHLQPISGPPFVAYAHLGHPHQIPQGSGSAATATAGT